MFMCSINEDMAMRCVMLSCVGAASAMVRAQLQRKIVPNLYIYMYIRHTQVWMGRGTIQREERKCTR